MRVFLYLKHSKKMKKIYVAMAFLSLTQMNAQEITIDADIRYNSVQD